MREEAGLARRITHSKRSPSGQLSVLHIAIRRRQVCAADVPPASRSDVSARNAVPRSHVCACAGERVSAKQPSRMPALCKLTKRVNAGALTNVDGALPSDRQQ